MPLSRLLIDFALKPSRRDRLSACQVVQVRRTLDQSEAIKLINGLFPQRVNIHGFALDEVFDPPFDLRGATIDIWAVEGRFSLGIAPGLYHIQGIAGCTLTGFVLRCSSGQVYARHFRYDFTALFHKDVIANAEVKAGNFIGVVKGGPLHSRSGKKNGLQFCNRCYRACSAYLVGDAC